MLEAVNLVKIYSNGLKAVDNVSIKVDGGIHSIYGVNGSGKSTTLHMCSGNLKPTKGKVYVDGFDMWGGDWIEARKLIGYSSHEIQLNMKSTPLDNLIWYGMQMNMGLMEARITSKRLLREAGIYEFRNIPLVRLREAVKRLIKVLTAYLKNPSIVILDEPTYGLDWNDKIDIWNRILRVNERRTLIFSTCDYKLVHKFCDKTYLMYRGKIIAHGPPMDLTLKFLNDKYVGVTFHEDIEPPIIKGVKPLVNGSTAWYNMDSLEIGDIIDFLRRHNFSFRKIELIEPNIEYVYQRITRFNK